MHNSEPVQSEPPFKEVTVLTMGGSWGDLAQAARAQDPDPFADPDSTLPSPTTHDDELPRVTIPSIVLPPTLDPFTDPPPALVSTFHDGDGPSRLSRGSAYDDSTARVSMSSSHVGCAV
jgi:hypothetical protein